LNAIYVYNDVVYLQLKLTNESQVSYDINAVRFFIRDRKKSKRSAVQEREVQPIYVYGNEVAVEGKSSQLCVIALPKFTLSDHKYLFIQMTEKQGGRDLSLKLRPSQLLKAKVLLIDTLQNN
jgi:conjugative transposon TraN protein